MPVEDVANFVSNVNCGAGATLDVTSSGEISSSCEGLGIEDNRLSLINYYPTLVEDVLNIDTSSIFDDQLMFSIYSIEGQLLISKVLDTRTSDHLKIDLSDYAKGVYFVELQHQNNFETFRIYKK